MWGQALGAAGAEWHLAVEATGWELMLQFARRQKELWLISHQLVSPRSQSATRANMLLSVASSARSIIA